MTVINIIEVRKTNSGGVADVDSIQSFSIYDEQESGEVYAEAMKCFKDTILKQFPAMEETHSDEDFAGGYSSGRMGCSLFFDLFPTKNIAMLIDLFSKHLNI